MTLLARFCIRCGRSLSKDVKYCTIDGLPVENQDVGRIANCVNCGYLLPQVANYCDSCGYPQ